MSLGEAVVEELAASFAWEAAGHVLVWRNGSNNACSHFSSPPISRSIDDFIRPDTHQIVRVLRHQ